MPNKPNNVRLCSPVRAASGDGGEANNPNTPFKGCSVFVRSPPPSRRRTAARMGHGEDEIVGTGNSTSLSQLGENALEPDTPGVGLS
jgi:hypothetical protein